MYLYLVLTLVEKSAEMWHLTLFVDLPVEDSLAGGKFLGLYDATTLLTPVRSLYLGKLMFVCFRVGLEMLLATESTDDELLLAVPDCRLAGGVTMGSPSFVWRLTPRVCTAPTSDVGGTTNSESLMSWFRYD